MNPQSLRNEALHLWVKLNYSSRLSNNGHVVHTVQLDGSRLTTTDLNTIWTTARKALGKVNFSMVKAIVLYYSLQNQSI